MAKFARGKFTMRNPAKYVGNKTPTCRSGWEWTFMQFCDNNKNVLKWASEAISIPYRSPLTGKMKNYIPDFFVVYQNKYGQQLAEVVEIKPKKQSLIESRVASAKDRAVVENGQVVVRPINYLALSYDHRIIDGREAVLGLVAMKDALEDPSRLLLDL